jgi:hypothetical protein
MTSAQLQAQHHLQWLPKYPELLATGAILCHRALRVECNWHVKQCRSKRAPQARDTHLDGFIRVTRANQQTKINRKASITAIEAAARKGQPVICGLPKLGENGCDVAVGHTLQQAVFPNTLS